MSCKSTWATSVYKKQEADIDNSERDTKRKIKRFLTLVKYYFEIVSLVAVLDLRYSFSFPKMWYDLVLPVYYRPINTTNCTRFKLLSTSTILLLLDFDTNLDILHS